jgi:hypothetical protein
MAAPPQLVVPMVVTKFRRDGHDPPGTVLLVVELVVVRLVEVELLDVLELVVRLVLVVLELVLELLELVLELVLVELLEVEVVLELLVVVVWHPLRSMRQSPVHTSEPPAEPQVAPPKSVPSHSSSGSISPLPHSGAVVEVLVLVEVVVLDELVLVDELDELVVVVVWHPLRSMRQPSVHTSEPPAEPQVAPPKSVPSHSSPASISPLPHSGAVVEVLVLVEVLVEDELVLDVELVVDVELVLDELVDVELVLDVELLLVVVVGVPTQVPKSIRHSSVQVRKPPPTEPQVASPKLVPSHSSPGSISPLPHSGAVLEVLVLVEVLVEEEELLLDEEVLVDVLVLLVLEVVGTPTHRQSTHSPSSQATMDSDGEPVPGSHCSSHDASS